MYNWEADFEALKLSDVRSGYACGEKTLGPRSQNKKSKKNSWPESSGANINWQCIYVHFFAVENGCSSTLTKDFPVWEPQYRMTGQFYIG